MAKIINLLSVAAVVAMAAFCLMEAAAAAKQPDWPPRCAAYKKASKTCVNYVMGKVPTLAPECCDGLHAYVEDAKTSTEKARAACYCVLESTTNKDYKKELVDDVAKQCKLKIPPAGTDCQKISI